MTRTQELARRKVVIFDMDGVIVDSEPRHERAFLDVVEEIGFAGKHNMRFADYVGRTDKVLWEDFVAKHHPVQTLDELLAMKRRRALELLKRDRPVFPGLKELVESLVGRYRLGLASGSERQVVDAVLGLDSFGERFEVSVSGSEVVNGKPDPEIFLRTAGLLKAAPSDCWVIEDSKPGVAAGLAAGMRVIAIANTHPPDQLTNAHHVVQRYDEISAILLPQALPA